jgi:heat shock protein HslJ
MAARRCVISALALSIATFASAGLSQGGFPFDSELILDAAPMRGSKRVPNMDVAANGAMVLEMWCNRIEGQLVVAGDTLTVLTGQATNRDCPPERAHGDAALLAALNEVTHWRREGNTLVLIGPRSLRFRFPTN